ncbi:MAG: DISARM system phospholipase D-like protein DrmC [Bryobacteraceae bacterium]
MQALVEAIVDLVALVSPTKVAAVAAALRGLARPADAPGADALAGTPAARGSVVRVLEAWASTPASGDEVAGMLLGASEARRRVECELNVELVWTGPTTRFVATRRTEQVLLDLIRSAGKDLFLVSFVAYDVPSIVKAMNEASGRGVRIRVLLEASASHGGSLSVDPAATMRGCVPSAEIYTWQEKPEPFVDGKVHAKVAVIDGARAFITSANLTGNALEKNMEAGVAIHGGPVPRTLRDHLEALIDVGVIGRA